MKHDFFKGKFSNERVSFLGNYSMHEIGSEYACGLNPDAENNPSVKLEPEVASGIYDIINENGKLSILEVAEGHVAVEYDAGNAIYVYEYNTMGHLRGAVFTSAADLRPIATQIEKISKVNKMPLFMAILFAHRSNGYTALTESNTRQLLTVTFEEAIKEHKCSDALYYQMSDVLKQGINGKYFPIEDSTFDLGGNLAKIEGNRVADGVLNGKLLFGAVPKILHTDSEEDATASAGTIKALMDCSYIKEYRERQLKTLSSEELGMIPDPQNDPDVADDAVVLPEVTKIAKHYVVTEKDSRRITNVAWKGITGYGKSTGCRQLARVLGMPYVVMSCSDETTTDDFLTRFVPVTENESLTLKTADNVSLPTAEQIANDPVGAWKLMTGEDDDFVGVTECIIKYTELMQHSPLQITIAKDDARKQREKAYYEAEMARYNVFIDPMAEADERNDAVEAETKAKRRADAEYFERMELLAKEERNLANAEKKGANTTFKMVEAPYALALRHGWLCEVQESSRIRKQGVLVGLNEYSRAGARVRTADGKSFFRSKRALTIFTDNVGYDTCRLADPSVIRRWDEVLTTPKLDKEFVRKRIEANVTMDESIAKFDDLYRVYTQTADFCEQRQISDGSCTIVELENWIKLLQIEGGSKEAIRDTYRSAIVNKCSDLTEEQEEIYDSVTAGSDIF